MNAIDFTTRLLGRILTSTHPPFHIATLAAIAAGLRTEEDIHTTLQLPSNSRGIHNSLKQLTQKEYLTATEDYLSGYTEYHLTEKGKNTLQDLLSFLPTAKTPRGSGL